MLKRVLAITTIIGLAVVVPTLAFADQGPDGGPMIEPRCESWEEMEEWMHGEGFDHHGMGDGPMMGPEFESWEEMEEWMHGEGFDHHGMGDGSMMGPAMMGTAPGMGPGF